MRKKKIKKKTKSEKVVIQYTESPWGHSLHNTPLQAGNGRLVLLVDTRADFSIVKEE